MGFLYILMLIMGWLAMKIYLIHFFSVIQHSQTSYEKESLLKIPLYIISFNVNLIAFW